MRCYFRNYYRVTAIFFLLSTLILSGCLYPQESLPDGKDLIIVEITRVIDGDTAYARFPDGREEKVRFIGVDAPEINHPVKGIEPFGLEAETYTRSRLEGKMLWLEIDVAERDQYGRILAYLWLAVPVVINDRNIRENMFNAHLLIEGYAVQVIFPPNVKYVDYFRVYVAEAKKNTRGLWGSENIEDD
jgi:micrococcal nuclease